MNSLDSQTVYSLVLSSRLHYQMNALYLVKLLLIKFQGKSKLHVE